jgi:RND family efflux transporter MFP subunit
VAGQEIAQLDTDLLVAEETRLKATRAAAAAQLAFAEARLKRAEQLQKQGFTSRERLDEALARRDELTNRIAETDAALMAVAINLEKSVLRAPVTGQVAAQTAETGETVRSGQHIVSIMDTAHPELRVGLPLELSAQDVQDVTLEVIKQQYAAQFSRFRPDIDPITRTRTALFTIKEPATLTFGQTASLVFETQVDTPGVWLPLDALQAGKGSVWTALTVVNDKIERATVELIHIDGQRAFVRGALTEGDHVVVSGAHRVVAGQTVRLQDLSR